MSVPRRYVKHESAALALVLLGACLTKPERVEPLDAPPADAAPDAKVECPATYAAVGTARYRHVSNPVSWDAARVDCRADGVGPGLFTHLVVLSGEAERSTVRNTYGGADLWLGVSDRVTTGTWRWVTLESVGAYPPAGGAPWKGGQPNDGGGGDEDCVLMEPAGGWDDKKCTDLAAYVCECDAFAEQASQSDPQQ